MAINSNINIINHIPTWNIEDNRLYLSINNNKLYPTAKEIIRIEFKGQKEYFGHQIKRPSEVLKGIEFYRFPCRLSLIIAIPSNNIGNPILKLDLEIVKFSYTLSDLPDSDQLVVNGTWISIIQEEKNEIQNILSSCKIASIGPVSLKQYFDLTRSSSQYIKFRKSTSSDSQKLQNDSFDFLKAINDNGFNADLYSYQKSGVSWLRGIAQENIGCILADEMGLGKTIQIIALITLFKDIYSCPSMIVAPATLLENWRREFKRFSNRIKTLVHSGTQRTGFPSVVKQFDVVITSYDIVSRDLGMLKLIEWGFIILDEAQAIKNSETKRAISAKDLKKKVGIAVTGTPIENKLLDLWSLMDFACQGLLGDKDQFESTFVDNIEGAQKLEKIITPLILRRKVVDVATDLPEKIIIPQVIELSDESINDYEELRESIVNDYGDSATLVSLIKLRQFCTHPYLLNGKGGDFPEKHSTKYQRLIEVLDEIVLQKQKVIIFTSFKEMIDLLTLDLSTRYGIKCFNIDGRTAISERQIIVDNYSNITGSTILILNPKAAGTGLNITAANHVIHYNLEWNPATEDQATARAYRRGQSLPVIVHRLYYADTIEEIMNDRLDRKRTLAETAIVGTDTFEINKTDITNILNLSPRKLNKHE